MRIRRVRDWVYVPVPNWSLCVIWPNEYGGWSLFGIMLATARIPETSRVVKDEQRVFSTLNDALQHLEKIVKAKGTKP